MTRNRREETILALHVAQRAHDPPLKGMRGKACGETWACGASRLVASFAVPIWDMEQHSAKTLRPNCLHLWDRQEMPYGWYVPSGEGNNAKARFSPRAGRPG